MFSITKFQNVVVSATAALFVAAVMITAAVGPLPVSSVL